jgi:hypothetical protein
MLALLVGLEKAPRVRFGGHFSEKTGKFHEKR